MFSHSVSTWFSSPALFVFLSVLVINSLRHLVMYYEHVDRNDEHKEELRLKSRVRQLEEEAACITSTDEFAKAAKLRREAMKCEVEIRKIEERRSLRVKQYRRATLSLGRILRLLSYGLYGYVLWMYWNVPLAILDKDSIGPFGKMY